jgi:malonyl-CoA/methylmalonyl-CoA synthetase
MTEIGMALGNPLITSPAHQREPGKVGIPFPKVEIKILDDTGKEVTKDQEVPGELYVKGPQVFKEYWGREEATREVFDADGW